MKGFILVRKDDGRLTPFVHVKGLGVDDDLVKVALNRLGGFSVMVYTSEGEARAIARFYDDVSVLEVSLEVVE